MHRKTRMIPAGHIAGAVILALALAAITLALFAVPSANAAANTSWVAPVSQSVMQTGASLKGR